MKKKSWWGITTDSLFIYYVPKHKRWYEHDDLPEECSYSTNKRFDTIKKANKSIKQLLTLCSIDDIVIWREIHIKGKRYCEDYDLTKDK